MATYGMNDVKNGMKILVNNEPAIITETDYVKPGKGQAFTRMRFRLIRSGRVQELTLKSTDAIEAADVVDTDMQEVLRDTALEDFPIRERFIELHRSGQLQTAAETAAKLLAYLASQSFGTPPVTDLRAL